MGAFFEFLDFALFIAMIVGLIKPSLIMFWSKNPKRIKVLGWWILSFMFLAVLSVFLENDKSKLKEAQRKIEKKEYSAAISTLGAISKESEYFSTADSLKNQARILLTAYNDSIAIVKAEEAEAKRLAKLEAKKAKQEEAEAKRLAELEAKKAKQKEERGKNIEQLKREIASIDDGVDFSTYRGTVDALQIELIMFGTWSSIIKEGLESEDREIKSLATKLKSKVAYLQTKQFPILRKEYAKVLANIMWEYDITVKANGTGSRYINFTGGVFAANKNKKDFQESLHEILTMFRFSQSRYRWYDGQDKYTYWTVYEGKDSDLVTFNK